MNDPDLTPVFPLPLVVCPGEPVALHIFEPRYKEMIARCRAQQSAGGSGEFVIVYTNGERWAPIGCVMQIARVIKEYDDKRLDIIAVGRRRCRIGAAPSDASYPTGRVEKFSDEAEDWDERLANEVFNAHRRAMTLATGKEPPASDYAGHASLSFYVMPLAGLPPERKLEMLQMTSENERLRALSIHLQNLIHQLIRAHEAVTSIQHALQAARILRG